MRTITIDPTFRAWRSRARTLLDERVHPNDVIWSTKGNDTDELFGFAEPTHENVIKFPVSQINNRVKVPAYFIKLSETVSCHRSQQQWSMLYHILWSITYEQERDILVDQTNDTMRKLEHMRKSISRDIHKMRAFVRFRQVDSIEPENNRENYVAWFEPEHLIVRANTPFFRKRFAGMNWSILTPDECVHWDGNEISYTEGVDQSHAPEGDELEELWKGYYRSIFNPARVKIKMMQSEMPKKYWKNLPEAEIIEELIQTSTDRVNGMMKEENRPLKPEPKNKYLDHLKQLNDNE